MLKKILSFMLLSATIFLTSKGTAFAFGSYLTPFNTQYLAPYQSSHPGQGLTIANCGLCHVNPGGGGTKNAYGNAYVSSGYSYTAIEALDSDGDGFSNLTEIMAFPETYPGDSASHPAPAADTTKPVVTAFTIPATASSLVVSITTLTATDAVGVTGYMATESATAPLASAAGWTAAKPANYSFTTAGAKTLYGWAKDAAGNVSLSMSAAVTITLPDTTKPLVTAFTIPATASSLVVSITTLTATDAVGVTGYMATESATAPLASAGGWSAAKPASYSFTTAGAKTLYAWAKDAAGNVSLSMSAAVTITIVQADTVKPMVTAFTIPATASSLVVPVSTLTATDAVGVTGYMITESATAPLAGAAGWSAAKPADYTFASEGAKTLYAWAKDAAGNVSLSLSAPVTITLIAQADAVKPVVTAFTTPAASSSLVVPITTFSATDNVSVTGYKLTTNATAPAATANGWTANAPNTHTFANAGAKTLYAWAKDAAGNVSLSLSASVTITIDQTDTAKPVVTAFTIPATSSSLVVPITVLTATDDVSVTGYKLTTKATAPATTANGWKANPPKKYTFANAGGKTLHAWAKDAAGNVSLSLSAPVTIVLADTARPVLTAFSIPATSSSLVVPITALAATDNVKVTGYKLTTKATAPAATAKGWKATAPAKYTFAKAGTKTLYVWAKDAADNVSLSMSAPVTIVLADTVKPVVTAFTVPATSSSLIVPITTLTATDNVKVTGYKLTTGATAPAATAKGWTASAPKKHTFVNTGAKTLRAWAKDAAGNVSLAQVAMVTVTSGSTGGNGGTGTGIDVAQTLATTCLGCHSDKQTLVNCSNSQWLAHNGSRVSAAIFDAVSTSVTGGTCANTGGGTGGNGGTGTGIDVAQTLATTCLGCHSDKQTLVNCSNSQWLAHNGSRVSAAIFDAVSTSVTGGTCANTGGGTGGNGGTGTGIDVAQTLATTCLGCHSDKQSLVNCSNSQWLAHSGSRVSAAIFDAVSTSLTGGTCANTGGGTGGNGGGTGTGIDVAQTLATTCLGCHSDKQSLVNCSNSQWLAHNGSRVSAAIFDAVSTSLTGGTCANTGGGTGGNGGGTGTGIDVAQTLATTCLGCHSDKQSLVNCSNSQWLAHNGSRVSAAIYDAVSTSLTGAVCGSGGGTTSGVPADHTDRQDRVRHKPGKNQPYTNGCTTCHGNDLRGGIAPSCYSCHGREWGNADDAIPRVIPLIPLPAAGEQAEFSYAPTESPFISPDPATAMPIGVGPVAAGGDTVNLQVSFAQFQGPVDVYLYLTVATPAGGGAEQLIQTFTYNAALNNFELISGGNIAPWKAGVAELNETIWANLPVAEFTPGNYKFILGVTPAGQHDSHYNWTTSFTIQ